MNNLITIAVDAMGGDGSPQKVIKGIQDHHKKVKIFSIEFLEINTKF